MKGFYRTLPPRNEYERAFRKTQTRLEGLKRYKVKGNLASTLSKPLTKTEVL